MLFQVQIVIFNTNIKSVGSNGGKRTPEDLSIRDNKRRKVEYFPDGKLPIPDGLLDPKLTTGHFYVAKYTIEANLTLNQYGVVSCEPLSVEKGPVYVSVDADSFDREKLSSGSIYSIPAVNKEEFETVCK